MADGYNHERLKREIVAMSKATDWEYKFFQNTKNRRSTDISPSMISKRREINNKVLEAIKKRGFQGPD